ncbi:hypothetical protein WCE14_08620 [Acinetobacter schindleri]|uniref:hypothetical protein n=1 Tax=Acinetobacter schindleri TaxID=108981 RepID=UPI0034D3FA7A
MAIEKLTEFAKTGQKNTDDLNLETGFIVNRKPARQWFNWLFNTLTLKINEIINADFMPKSDVVDNLTTDDATKPVSAKQAKLLQDNKLGKTENAATTTKLANARTISFSGAATGSFNFDGSSNASAILTLANSGVAASTYGSNLKIPVITVDGKGLITGVSEQTIPSASTTQAGVLKLNNTLTSTSTNEAATAAQVKVLNDQAFGVGQRWRDLTSSRLANTRYTNTGNKTIYIFVSKRLTSTATNVVLKVSYIPSGGSEIIFEFNGGGAGSSGTYKTAECFLPIEPGASYLVDGFLTFMEFS